MKFEAKNITLVNAGNPLILLCFCIQLMGVSSAWAISAGTCLNVSKVERWDFLYIRARPDHRSRKVGAIAPNSESPLVVSGKCTPNTQNLKRLWCPVEYYISAEIVKKGYVKMYFTKQAACPPALEFYRKSSG